jgi:hypothetical protein
MLARISLRKLVFSLALEAGLVSAAAGQVGYYYPPYQTWPPSSPGFYPAPVPPLFWPYQLTPYTPYFGSAPLFTYWPDYSSYPYGDDLTGPGYSWPDTYGYPYYGSVPYPYQYPYYSPYYAPQGPYLWRGRGPNYGPRRPWEQPGPTEVRPRNDARARNEQRPRSPQVRPPNDPRAWNERRPGSPQVRPENDMRARNPQEPISNRGPQGGPVTPAQYP